jgi:glucokinase
MLLAGDIGGTKTLLGLFESSGARPVEVAIREFETNASADPLAMIAEFKSSAGATDAIAAACFGVAGPVVGSVGQLTNVPWRIDAEVIARICRIPRVVILNDLVAMAHGVPHLTDGELHTLQRGTRRDDGNIAVIAAGTGLGQALLHNVGGRYIPSPGEGGHADFAPRTDREIAVLRDITSRFGRASVEHVLSGRGLENLHRVTHDGKCLAANGEHPDAPAISAAALAGTCPGCVEALEIFVEVYGAEAGNHALRSLATGGVYIGGGIAPKILRALTDGRFMRTFVAKPPHVSLLTDMPVHIILSNDAGLVGAAVHAASMQQQGR